MHTVEPVLPPNENEGCLTVELRVANPRVSFGIWGESRVFIKLTDIGNLETAEQRVVQPIALSGHSASTLT